MSLRLPRIARLWIAVILAFAAAGPHPAAAQSNPFVITGVSTHYIGSDQWDNETASLTFQVKNNSGQTQTLVDNGDCGPFKRPGLWDPDIGGWDDPPSCLTPTTTPSGVAVAPGATQPVSITLYHANDGGLASLRVWSSANPAAATQISASVQWPSWPTTNVLSATLVEATYTPSGSSGSGSVGANTSTGIYLSVYNAGNAAATYSLGPISCPGMIACSLTYSSISVAAGAYGSIPVVIRTGPAGSTQTVTVPITAPPRTSGIVETAVARLTETAVDMVAPTISPSPGAWTADGSDYWPDPIEASHGLTLSANVCDQDGSVEDPVLTVAGATVAASSITATSISGCNTAKHAVWNITLAAGTSGASLAVSDGVHLTTIVGSFHYNDAPDHIPVVTAAHATETVEVGRLATDTFFVRNPGWHSAQYTIVAYCDYDPGAAPSCAISGAPASPITLAAGATATIPVAYTAPAYAGRRADIYLSASYPPSGATPSAVVVATGGAALPPVVTITPSDGSTVSTPTTTVKVTWCDPDDGIPTTRVTSQGATLSGDPVGTSVPGCSWSATSTFNNVVLTPWQHSFVATATDVAGHTTTTTATVSYNPPLSAFKPGLSPKGDVHVIGYAGTVTDTFAITNVGSYPATYTLTPRCGVHAGCSVSPSTVTLSPNAITSAVVSYSIAAAPILNDTVSLIASYAAPTGATVADTGKRVLAEATFTPSVAPKQAIALSPNTFASRSITVWNLGTARATYALSTPACTGAVVNCTLTPSMLTIDPGQAAVASLAFKTGAIGGSGSAHVTATAPPRLSGVVARDSATLDVSVVDLIPPTLTISPAGDYHPDEAYYDVYYVATRPSITIDACDADGAVSVPTLTLSGVSVAPTSTSATTVAGCATARRTIFNPPFIAGTNRIVAWVTDGVHSVSATADYSYDDAGEHTPVLSMRALAATVPINRTVTDTLWVRNPGWHSAQYATYGTCSWTTPIDHCALSGIPATVSVGAGASLGIPFTYTTPSAYPFSTTINFVATYTNSLGQRRAYLTASPTTGALIPPTITLTPSDGATVSTATVDITARWCDEDDGIMQRAVIWQGRPLSMDSVVDDPSCTNGSHYAWRGVPIDPWAQTLVATATDHAGHSVTQTATVTRLASLTLFQPRVIALASTKRSALQTAAVDTFVVRNAGAYAATYTLAATCASLTNCSESLPSVSLAPGDSVFDVVSYTASNALDSRDTIEVVATYTSPVGSAIADTGRSVSTVPSIEAAATVRASPDAATAPTTWVGQAFYSITNNSSSAVTYDLSIVPTGGWGFPDWFTPPTSLTIEAGQVGNVSVFTKAPAFTGARGAYTLTASYLATDGRRIAASATSSWVSVALDPEFAVLPKNGTQSYATNGVGQYVDFSLIAPGNTSFDVIGAVDCDSTAAHCRWDPVNADGHAAASPGVTSHLRVDFDPVSRPFRMTLHAAGYSSGVTILDSASVTLIGDGPFLLATVSPKASALTTNVNTALAQRFTVSNAGNVAATFHYVLNCDGAIAASCSTPPRDSVVLLAGQRDSFVVTLRAPPQLQQTGNVRLIASAVAGGLQSTDTATVVVNSAAVSAISVDTRGPSAGANIAREHCLTVSAGDDAAFECGDLRLVHALPMTATLGKPRIPTLVYESRQQSALALISADVTVAAGVSLTSITASVKIDGRDTVSRTFAWNPAWPAGRPYRVVVPVDASSLRSGAYHYTFAVDATDGVTRQQQQDTGTVAIVNRSTSQFGPGWWLDGFEQLVPYSATQMLWIGGDGSTRLYARTAADTTIWLGPLMDRPDSLVQTGGSWYRRLRNGAYVQFDALLRHVATVDTHGHVTSFAYDPQHALSLASVSLPVPIGSAIVRRYDFVHDPSTQILVRVDAPTAPGTAIRQTTIGYVAVNGVQVVRSITDPDGSTVSYAPDASGQVAARVDRRGYTTSFQFDAARALTASTLDMAGTAPSNITHAFCASETYGLSGCAPGLVPSDSVTSWIAGPRNVGDTTWFELDRFGGPVLIVDALHDSTRIERADAHWPLLATKIVDPRGHATTATYDATRGLLLSTTDLNGLALTANGAPNTAPATYTWDARWDRVIRATSPMGVVSEFTYDANSGERTAQSSGSSRTRRVTFDYDPATREVAAITTAQSPTPTRYTYDAAGNLASVTSSQGIQSTVVHDYVGHDSIVGTMIDDTPVARWHWQIYTYDLADRVLSTTDSAATTASDPTPQRLTVLSSYDAEGNLTGTTRRISPDPFGLGDIVLGSDYDAANRKTREFDPFGAGTTRSWEYDAAGNVIAAVRAGARVTSEYDVLNRVTHRVVPGAASAYTPEASADDQRFAYDVAGNLISATNKFAQIGRAYTLGGLLAVDSLRIATADLSSSNFTAHSYINTIGYDLDRRRTSFTPAALGGLLTPVSYDYDEQTGDLRRVTSVGGGSFTYYRGPAGLLDSLVEADGTVERHRYDDDGREIGRTEISPIVGTLHDETIALDARGKRVQVNYSSLNGASADLYEYDGMGGAISVDGRTIERTPRDPLGNAQLRSWNGSDWSEQYLYEPHSTRMHYLSQRLTDNFRTDSLSQSFDAAGDLRRVLEQITGYLTCSDQTGRNVECQGGDRRLIAQSQLINSYDGDGHLVLAIKETTNDQSGLWVPVSVRNPNDPEVYPKFERGVTEEYRYDALGRRVWVRAHRDPYCPGAHDRDSTTICLSTVERTIYDGDQVIAEIRQPGDDSASVATLENDGPSLHGPLNQFGLTGYVHGSEIDHPLELARQYQGDVTRLVLHYHWQGHLELATTLDGQLIQCGLPIPAPNCEEIQWPGSIETFGMVLPHRALGPASWWGTLAGAKENATGVLDMRNRQYDPRTGRFTQEDPIGLAGGVNLYGFGGGDAVSFADPFGLCPDVHGVERGREFCPGGQGLATAGLLDPIAWLSGGLTAAIEYRLAGAGAQAIASSGSLVLANKAAGDAFRDELASAFENNGYGVAKEVGKKTPFGRRVIDVEVSKNGEVIGGIEAKVGKSRYLLRQMAKDEYLRRTGYPVQLVRDATAVKVKGIPPQ